MPWYQICLSLGQYCGVAISVGTGMAELSDELAVKVTADWACTGEGPVAKRKKKTIASDRTPVLFDEQRWFTQVGYKVGFNSWPRFKLLKTKEF